MIRSSSEWSGSKSSCTAVVVSSPMVTDTTWNSSWMSAVAASGRLSASRFSTTISAVCGTRAPFHRRGRNGLTGDAIAAEIMSAGFNPERDSYPRSYGSNDLDAAVLVLPLLNLEPRDSPRVRATIDAVRRELDAGGPLLYRYPPGQDGLPGTEGAFLPCSFWLVQALASTAASTKRPSCSPTSWSSPTRSASCPRRSTPEATATSATTPRLSPTPHSSRPPWPSATPNLTDQSHRRDHDHDSAQPLIRAASTAASLISACLVAVSSVSVPLVASSCRCCSAWARSASLTSSR
jgi:hypothetical protein